MNIVVDVGNTRVKFAVFEGVNMILNGFGADELLRFAGSDNAKGARLLISGSGAADSEIYGRLAARFGTVLHFSDAMSLKLPVVIDYSPPETLGPDRIADAVAAVSMFPGRELLVVDAGSAVTYDRITAAGVFTGGCISPGLDMRFRALHEFTARLPRCVFDTENAAAAMGHDTESAIHSGVVRGLGYEARGHISDFLNEYPEGIAVISGGDCEALKFGADIRIKTVQFLGLSGLNAILEYNV